MIQNLFVACGLALSVGISSIDDHNADRMYSQSANDTIIYDGGVTTVTTQYQYQTNEVNSIDDLVVGNIYKFIILGDDRLNIQYFRSNYIYYIDDSDVTFSISKSNESLIVRSRFNTSNSSTRLYVQVGYSANLYVTVKDNQFYAVYNGLYENDLLTYFTISASDYLGEEITSVTNVMPTSLLQIFDNFINERIFNHSTLTTLKTTIFGQEMSVASWLSLSVSIILGILFIVVLIKGAIWLFKIVGNIALLR